MKPTHPPLAKIVNHSEGLGVPTSDTVRQRAFELARIEGRDRFTEQEWEQAKRELHGGHALNDEDAEMAATVSERDMTLSDLGHHAENVRYDDTGSAVELVAEGMDEAMHEQRLEAAAEMKRSEDGLV